MRTVSKLVILCLFSLVTASLVACGGSDDDSVAGDGAGMSGSPSFDESQLPADFPRDLIPGDYDSADYASLGQVTSAVFENRTPVAETIDQYIALLGEPDLNVDTGDGDRSAQWNTKPWTVGILGDDSESIIGFSKITE